MIILFFFVHCIWVHIFYLLTISDATLLFYVATTFKICLKRLPRYISLYFTSKPIYRRCFWCVFLIQWSLRKCMHGYTRIFKRYRERVNCIGLVRYWTTFFRPLVLAQKFTILHIARNSGTWRVMVINVPQIVHVSVCWICRTWPLRSGTVMWTRNSSLNYQHW